MNDSGASIIFCDGDRFKNLAPLLREGKLPLVRKCIISRETDPSVSAGFGDLVMKLDDLMTEAAKDGRMRPPEVTIDQDDNAIIMYTSGTTGALVWS